MDAIKTSGLSKRYKDLTAVAPLDLTVRQGELFSLLGVNGAGKTTLIKMLSCLTRPTAGDAELLGHSSVFSGRKTGHRRVATGNSGRAESDGKRKFGADVRCTWLFPSETE